MTDLNADAALQGVDQGIDHLTEGLDTATVLQVRTGRNFFHVATYSSVPKIIACLGIWFVMGSGIAREDLMKRLV